MASEGLAKEQVVKQPAEGRAQRRKSSKKQQQQQVRFIPIWLRIIILLVSIFVSVVIGAVIGYSIIGDGDIADVFKMDTWTHIIDLVRKGE
jgi:DNA-directed RNA polymerase subunit beta